MIKKYRKLPVVVDVIQLTRENWYECIEFIDKKGFDRGAYEGSLPGELSECSLVINTLEGKLTAKEYDYIIKGVKGEFYPCKPDIFEATYEEFIGEECIGQEEISYNHRILEEYRNYYKKRMADITIRRQYKCQIMKLIKKLFSK